MLSPIFPQATDIIEAYVLSVDGKRRVCSVQTLSGRVMASVMWMSPHGGTTREGFRSAPKRGDRVLVSTSASYPIIVGSLPSLSEGSEKQLSLFSSTELPEIGNVSQIGSQGSLDPYAPHDLVPGDQVTSTDSGSSLGVLRGGSILAKASPLAQIFLSRINSFVRIVSRNWDHFTDTFVDVARNIGGRAFRFTGYSDTAEHVRNDDYRYYEVLGDVAAGESIKWNYNGKTLSDLPAAGPTLFKRSIVDSSASNLAFETWNSDGTVTRKVQVSGGGIYSQLTHSSNDFQVVTEDGTLGTFYVKGGTIHLDVAGVGSVEVTNTTVTAKVGSSDRVQLSSGQVQVKSGSSTGTYTPSQIELLSSGHGVLVSSAGVDLF